MRLPALATLLAATASAGIYPSGHFDVSTKLTTDNYQSVIQSAVEGDKTLVVRWIASEG